MFRAAAACLSLILALGPVPAQAQVLRGIVVEAAAPVPVLAPPLSPAAVSVSAAPALSAAAFAPALTALPSPAVAAPALAAAAAPAAQAVKALAAAPGGVAAARVAPVGKAFAAPAAGALPDYGPVFDGGRRAAAADGVEPVRAPDPGPAAAPRLFRATSTGRVLRFSALGAVAAAALPALWSAAPTDGQLVLFGAAALPILAATAMHLTARAVYRKIAGVVRAPSPAPSRRRAWAQRAAGFALGAALMTAVSVERVPLIVGAHAYLDSRAPVAERVIDTPIPGNAFGTELSRALAKTPEGRAALERVHGRMPAFVVKWTAQAYVAVPGRFIADETARVLSLDPVGREVLDELRDRGGVLRMPAFYVSYQKGSEAYYGPPESVTLSAASIEAGGVTVEEFLRSPAAQTAYVEREQGVLAHELRHADQARRSPFDSDTRTLVKTNAGRLIAAVKAHFLPAAPKAATDAAPAPAAAAPDSAAVVIDGDALERAGVPVERFVNDPALQKEYIASHQTELASALKSAPAVESAPVRAAAPKAAKVAAAPDSTERPAVHFQYGNIMEWEYEAYFTEHDYTHERLKADPAREMPADELSRYVHDLMGFDDFLASKDSNAIYAGNFHSHSAYYARYLADRRARWDADRVDAYVLLARRAQALGHPGTAHQDMDSARRIAAENGLPKPVFPGN